MIFGKMQVMKQIFFVFVFHILVLGFYLYHPVVESRLAVSPMVAPYWLMLERASNKEFLYKGVPGDKEKSVLIRTFRVKTGVPGQRPTPLSQRMGREYWLITAKSISADNPETAPYFLTLNIPAPTEYPFGPSPYEECNGSASSSPRRDGQCNWQLLGEFGLHGVNGDESKLSDDDPGSSGCIRHSDADIAYLYQLLDLATPVRYYIDDK